jgi:hypothetical protein
VYTLDLNHMTKEFYGDRKVEVGQLPRDDLRFPENLSFYIEHLNQLGLAGIFQVGNQEPVWGPTPQFKDGIQIQLGVRSRSEYRLTDLGRRFVRACIP